MSKQQRHELKKTEKARWRRAHRKSGAGALGAAAAIAAGTQAYAAPIRFDNPPGPGHFDWTPDAPGYTYLDIHLPFDLQPGGSDPSPIDGFELAMTNQFSGGYSSVIGVNAGAIGRPYFQVGGLYDYFLVGVDAGQVIPSGAPLRDFGVVLYPGLGSDSELPDGQQTYLGVRVPQPDGLHWGWVGIIRSGFELDAFAWGYETTPGVPIAAGVPEPGTLALLAFGAVGALSRRKRA